MPDPRGRYFLLLIDLKDSSRLDPPEAETAFREIEEELRRRNRRLRQALAVRLRLSYGDEVAGLFHEALPCYDSAIAIRDRLVEAGVQMRYVIAQGRIARASDDIRKVGGEVFKRASKAMAELKRSGRLCGWMLDDPRNRRVLTNLGELSGILVGEMTSYQHRIYTMLRAGVLQKTIADQLKKTEQSVSAAKLASHAEQVIEAESFIRDVLCDTPDEQAKAG